MFPFVCKKVLGPEGDAQKPQAQTPSQEGLQ